MRIEQTNYGIKVVIPESDTNSEFTYKLRQVKTLNASIARKHPIIDKLAEREKVLTRKLLLRVRSMEYVFKDTTTHRKYGTWNDHNRMDFNEYYHDELRDMEEAINAISFTYADYCNEGWPNHQYSCVL